MSDITTTTQDTYRNACVTAYSFLASAIGARQGEPRADRR